MTCEEWHKTSENTPTADGQYLCCRLIGNESIGVTPYFSVYHWSNDLYEVDDYDFVNEKGVAGFYEFDRDYGYCQIRCDYWREIEWSEVE